MAETSLAPRRRRPVRTAVTLILLAVGLVLLVSLGNWQVRRLHWKENLLADIAARRAEKPVTVAKIGEILASGGDINYRPVTVTGTFDNAREQDFFATFNGRTGYYIYTPMALADGETVFVNRGFVPFEKKEPDTRKAGQIEGEVTVTGLARSRLQRKPSWFVPDNEPAKNIYYWKDIDAMTARAGLDKSKVLQFFIDADDKPNPGGLPIGGVTQIDFPNNHLQYAITWYGLAVALSGVALLSWLRGRKKQES